MCIATAVVGLCIVTLFLDLSAEQLTTSSITPRWSLFYVHGQFRRQLKTFLLRAVVRDSLILTTADLHIRRRIHVKFTGIQSSVYGIGLQLLHNTKIIKISDGYCILRFSLSKNDVDSNYCMMRLIAQLNYYR